MIDLHWITFALVLMSGLCFGSFITLASYRLPRHEDIVLKPSRCPVCDHKLNPRDMVPVLSWCLNPRCRFCKTRIHWRYPAIELATASAFALIYLRYGINAESLLLLLLAVALLVMIVADFEHYVIPDEVPLVLLPAGLARGWLVGNTAADMLYGTLLCFGVGLALHVGYRKLRHKDGLGFGDVKFLGVAGLWLGVQPVAPFLFLSGLLGVATGLIWRAFGRGKLFPFGPALAMSLFLCIVFPEVPRVFWNMQWLLAR